MAAKRRAPDPRDALDVSSTSVAEADRPRPLTRAELRSSRVVATRNLRTRTSSEVVAATEKALVAAAEVLDPSDSSSEVGTPNALTRTWQHAVWGYTRSVGELNAGMMYVGNAFSRVSLAVGLRRPDGSVEQGFDHDEPVEDLDNDLALEAQEIIGRIGSPRGGQRELLRSAGEKLFATGEAYLLPGDSPMGMVYECLSTSELRREGNGWVRYYGPGYRQQPVPEGINPVRLWRPDSQWTMLATSSVRSCMEILEELVVLTRLVRASAINRMSLAGMLLLPDELDSPEDEADAGGMTAEAMNPLATDLIMQATKAIDDPASAAAYTPFLLQGPQEMLASIRYIEFNASSSVDIAKRQEAMLRLAQALDLPVEVFLGHQNTTYANAAQVSQDVFNIHLEPSVSLVCDAITSGILWPELARLHNLSPDDVKENGYPPEFLSVACTYDARKLVSKPNMTDLIASTFVKDPTQMSVRISELREALGLDPDEVVDPQELAERLDALRLGKIRETIAAPVSDAAQPIEKIGESVVPGQSAGSKLIGGVADGSVATSAAPPAPVTADGSPGTPASVLLVARVSGAAEMTVERCVEKLGAKLRSKCASKSLLSPAERAAIDGVSNAELARTLGPQVVERLLADGGDPLAPEVNAFARTVSRWATDQGLPAESGPLAKAVVHRLAMERAFGRGPGVARPEEWTSCLVASEAPARS